MSPFLLPFVRPRVSEGGRMSLAENINEAFLRPSSSSLTERKSYHTHI